ncbi:type II secretion system protein F [Tersicoccus phoenicis]|uniref:Type II secretion system protein F n=1 Tax=Tersicoccus phoenicis TaxID=554083 RepID=A0A1R1LHS8_9MICC|nr:type II secretion system F family protein [Tersicoccus phoenicis]OMH27083.1 type II secretion system protein F [Tersicoccus phoenicis]
MTAELVGWAVLSGAGLGLGLWLAVVRLPVLRAPTFADRIAPQLRASSTRSRLLDGAGPVTPFGPVERIFRPVLVDVARWFSRFTVGGAATGRRLAQAGRDGSVLDYRVQQVLWCGLGLLVGTAVGVAGVLAGRLSTLAAALLVAAGAVGGFALRDAVLGAQIRRREARMLAEFPSLAELMALAVSAGESAGGALARVVRTSHGELAGEFGRVLAQNRAGTPLRTALGELSRRTALAPLSRFVDGLNVAIERGTPLADVLHAQAADVRDMSKRQLMEAAGRKEIGMMVPLVFGVLPLTVVFAVFPGIALLNLGL